MARRLRLSLAAALLVVVCTAPSAGAATTLTVAPTAPSGSNAFPFGIGVGWSTMGFVYKNLPPFELKSGDTIAFDLGAVNPQADIQLQIAMARTTVNGGDVPAQAYVTLVPNTQTPLNAKGNTINGDFELQFTSQSAFSFPGGGLIIRFSVPSAGYAADTISTNTLFNEADVGDPSGFFFERFFNDLDGLPPYSSFDGTSIAAFRLIIRDPPATPAPQPGKSKKRKCNKKKKKAKKRAAAAKKRGCKKKKKRKKK
jgi:hypothetical protein